MLHPGVEPVQPVDDPGCLVPLLLRQRAYRPRRCTQVCGEADYRGVAPHHATAQVSDAPHVTQLEGLQLGLRPRHLGLTLSQLSLQNLRGVADYSIILL